MGCISLKIKPLFPADNQFEGMSFCTQIENKGGLLAPLDPNTEFRPETEKIICLIRLQNVHKEIAVRWRWYDPQQKLVRDQEELVNYQDKLHSILTFLDELELSEIKTGDPIGVWTVVFELNGRMVERAAFEIKEPAGSPVNHHPHAFLF